MRLRNILLTSLISAPVFFFAGYLSHDKIENYFRISSYEELEKDAKRIFGFGDTLPMDPVWDDMPPYKGDSNLFYFDVMEDLKAFESKRRFIM